MDIEDVGVVSGIHWFIRSAPLDCYAKVYYKQYYIPLKCYLHLPREINTRQELLERIMQIMIRFNSGSVIMDSTCNITLNSEVDTKELRDYIKNSLGKATVLVE